MGSLTIQGRSIGLLVLLATVLAGRMESSRAVVAQTVLAVRCLPTAVGEEKEPSIPLSPPTFARRPTWQNF